MDVDPEHGTEPGMGAEYSLEVFYEGAASAADTISLPDAAAVMAALPALLEKHPGCHRIHVHAGHARLFSVDCEGRTVRD